MKNRILIIGPSWIETDFLIDSMPSGGGRATARSYNEGIGGLGASAALSAGKLGYATVLAGRLGDDRDGERVRSYLFSSGVDIGYLTRAKGEQTSRMIRLVAGSKAREILCRGADDLMDADKAVHAFLCEPQAVYIGSQSPIDVLAGASQAAKERDIPLFLHLDNVPEYPIEKIGQVDTVIVDAPVAEKLVHGVSTASIEGCTKVSVDMKRRLGAECVIIKRAEKGIYISYGKYYYAVGKLPVRYDYPEYADVAFDMAFIGQYLRWSDRERACEWANLVYALTASEQGKLMSVPQVDKVEKYGREYCPRLFGGSKNE